jgi:hypothetical protein
VKRDGVSHERPGSPWQALELSNRIGREEHLPHE